MYEWLFFALVYHILATVRQQKSIYRRRLIARRPVLSRRRRRKDVTLLLLLVFSAFVCITLLYISVDDFYMSRGHLRRSVSFSSNHKAIGENVGQASFLSSATRSQGSRPWFHRSAFVVAAAATVLVPPEGRQQMAGADESIDSDEASGDIEDSDINIDGTSHGEDISPADAPPSSPAMLPDEPTLKGLLGYLVGAGAACAVIVAHSLLVDSPPAFRYDSGRLKVGLSSKLPGEAGGRDGVSASSGASSPSGQRSSGGKSASSSPTKQSTQSTSKQARRQSKETSDASGVHGPSSKRTIPGDAEDGGGGRAIQAKSQRAKNRNQAAMKGESSAADVYDDEAFEALLAKIAGGRGDPGTVTDSVAGGDVVGDGLSDGSITNAAATATASSVLTGGDYYDDDDGDDEDDEDEDYEDDDGDDDDDDELVSYEGTGGYGRDPDSSRYSSSPDGSRGPTPVTLDADSGVGVSAGVGSVAAAAASHPANSKKGSRKGSIGSEHQQQPQQRSKRSPSSSLAVAPSTGAGGGADEPAQCTLCRQRYSANNHKKMCDKCDIAVCERCSGRYKYKYLGWSQARRICKPCNVKAQEEVARIREAGLQNKSVAVVGRSGDSRASGAPPASGVGQASSSSGRLSSNGALAATPSADRPVQGLAPSGLGPVAPNTGFLGRLAALVGVAQAPVGRRSASSSSSSKNEGQQASNWFSVCSISFPTSLAIAVSVVLLLCGGDPFALAQYDLLLVNLTTGVLIFYLCTWVASSAAWRQPRKKQKIQ